MRKTLLLFFALTANYITGVAQCTPPPLNSFLGGISSTAEALPCIQRGIYYDQTIRILLAPDSLAAAIGLSTQSIDTLIINSITGLPSGISYSISPNNGPHSDGDTYCIRFYGTTSDPVGDYPLSVQGYLKGSIFSLLGYPNPTTDPYFVTLFGIPTPQSMNGEFYFLTVSEQGAICHQMSVDFPRDTIPACLNDNLSFGLAHNSIQNATPPYTYSWASSNPNQPISGCTTCDSIKNNSVQHSTTYTVTVTDLDNRTATANIYLSAVNDDIHLVSPSDSLIFCPDDTITLSYTPSNASAQWQVNSTSLSSSVGDTLVATYSGVSGVVYSSSQGYIYLKGLCLNNSYRKIDSVFYNAVVPYSQQQICMVTVDSATGYNQIIFEPTHNKNISEYKIYKLNDLTSQYEVAGVIPYDSFSVFIDHNSNPAQQSSSYAISVIDSTCGTESAISTAHTTIHLSSNVGTSGEVNLAWNAYAGFSYSTFEIYRSNNGGAFAQIGNTANSVFSYTDLTPPSGTNRYYVAIAKVPACNPSRSVSSTISNILNPVTTGINEIENDNISAYPNPFTDKLAITPNTAYKLFDLVGREVYNSENKTNLSQLPVGTYILKTANGSTRVTKINE